MQRFFLYFTLVIAYLGLSKALSPSELGMDYVPNEKGLSRVIPGQNVTVILTDMHATGFVIKTYYQKYRLVYGFQGIEEMIVRTSRDYARKNKRNIGMSLFRRSDNVEETVPMPPGVSYIGNRLFGEWKTLKNGGTRWKFYRAYKNLPRYLGWGNWRPDQRFYDDFIASRERNTSYYGHNDEFGTLGKVTRKNFPNFFKQERQKKVSIKSLLVNYFKENF
ncbi:MAG: hypothetical protein K2P81_13415 [Bacteriovoracaceae bacterium]|nr:hypothetical protein [Bacteriovoracaceae bacterium]